MGKGLGRATRAVALVALGAAFAVPIAFAGDSADTVAELGTVGQVSSEVMVDESPQAYFVELNGSAATFRAEAKAAGIDYKERFAYGKLFNGVSIAAGDGQLAALQELGSVKTTYPVLELDYVPTPTPDLTTAVAMTGADLANGAGYTGTGVKVAVMDTGVDYNHSDLGGDGSDSDAASDDGVFDGDFPNSRVTTGHDFVGDKFDASEFLASGAPNPNYNPTPDPDPDPDDCNGHGTHVAGIVGAKSAGPGGVTGVAPDVKFGAYRVFGCGGSTTADIMLAAMERALADGMHVLNMSIGSAFQTWPQYPTAAGADKLVDAGMVVVTSIGNSGADGLYSAGAPGVGNNVIGTASYDNSHVALATFTVSPAGLTIGYANATAAPPAPTTGSLPLAKTGTPTTNGDGCVNPPAPGSMTGKAVLIRRGSAAVTCGFYDKALAAQNAGAAAVILYNNVAGRFSPTVAGAVPITIPVVAISDTEGVAINNAIEAGPQTLTWTAQSGKFVNATAGLISSFSSYGMNAELTLKPDIGAPGGLIRSTYPIENGTYATISGTSMASPHVAGAAALLRQARPTLAASQFRAVLQNSADPKNWSGNPGLGFLDFVHRQGAGMVDIDDSIVSTTTVTPGKLSLGEGLGGTATLTIANSGSSDETYTLGHTGALTSAPSGTTTSPFSFGVFAPGASAAFSAPSVVVPAGGTATVGVTITASGGIAEQAQYGGYITLTTGSGQVYRVPYAGLKGDYQSIVVVVPTSNGFPWLAKLSGGFYSKQSDGATYTFVNGDVPYFLAHLRHQSRKLEFTVVDAATGQELSGKGQNPNAIIENYLPRNATAGGFFAWEWDGKLTQNTKGTKTRVNVPNGTYKVVMKVLKALGDPANPAHTETWTSPSFTIARP